MKRLTPSTVMVSAAQRVGATRVGVLAIGYVVSPVQRWLYRCTRGRVSLTGRAPVLLVTTKGRRTGRDRTVPLLYVRDGTGLVVCNVNPGFERPNPWVLNLRANPEATVQLRDEVFRVIARGATHAETERLWPRLIGVLLRTSLSTTVVDSDQCSSCSRPTGRAMPPGMANSEARWAGPVDGGRDGEVRELATIRERRSRDVRGGRGNAAARRFARVWAALFGAGLLPRRWVTLEVAGRRTGRLTRFPLGIADWQGCWYLVPMLGENCNWVRNVRAADGLVTIRHGQARARRLVEVPVDERAPILKRYLAKVPGARPHVPVDRRAPLAEFAAIAAQYPAFRVEPASGRASDSSMLSVAMLWAPAWISTVR